MESNAWSNWAGNVRSAPARIVRPSSIEGIREPVLDAARRGSPVKVVGAGHSFAPAAATDGTLISLDDFAGIDEVRPLANGGALVTVRAGIRLHALNPLLWDLGLALPNLGDFAEQSVAGAISTGTHGTGQRLGGLATTVAALEVMTADGELVHCSPDDEPELFEAARLGVGALGVVTRMTLRCVPAFALHAVEGTDSLTDTLERIDHHRDATDHFEFFWFPYTDEILTKRNTRLPADVPLRPLSRFRAWFDEDFASNTLFEGVNRVAARYPRAIPRINAVSARMLSAKDYTDRSYRVFATKRTVRFTESEYAVPVEHARRILEEVRDWLGTHDEFRTAFPIEVRFAAADDVWLSTAHGRDVCYIAVHQFHTLDEQPYFEAFEEIVGAVGGRPHWGKMHSLTADDLRDLYPRFEDFLAVRDLVDPRRVFANDYTRRVFGD